MLDKYIFFFIIFIISFALMFSEKMELLGIGFFFFVETIFVFSTISDILSKIEKNNSLWLTVFTLIFNFIAVILFLISVTRLNDTFVAHGASLKLSESNRGKISYIESMFIAITVLLFIISISGLMDVSSSIHSILQTVIQFITDKSTLLFGALGGGLTILFFYLFSLVNNSTPNKNTDKYWFKSSIRWMGGSVLTAVLYYIFFAVAIFFGIYSVEWYLPGFLSKISGIATVILSIVAFAISGGILNETKNNAFMYTFSILSILALVIIAGLLLVTLPAVFGKIGIANLWTTLGDANVYAALSRNIIIALLVFTFMYTLTTYSKGIYGSEIDAAYITFSVLFFLLVCLAFIVSMSKETVIETLKWVITNGIPILTFIMSAYLLHFTNSITPLARNEIVQ